jgi:high-affinity iron transporter
MIKRCHRFAAALLAVLAIAALVDPISSVCAAPAERFEVTSLKAVRPTLVNTLDAVQKRDAAAAREAFEAYDSAWNGIEFYINTRSRPMYDVLEHQYQPKITKALEGTTPDFAALAPEVQGMLAKFDELVAMVEKAAPLNPFYDEVARLRIVRAHLREVPPALKAGNFGKARKSFKNFDDNWDSIEDLIKARSQDAYVAIEKGMIEIEEVLMPEKPDVAKATALVNEVMRQYNATLAEIAKDARAANR